VKKRKQTPRYTLMHEITASPTEPLPQTWRTNQLTKMWQGLHELETAESPSTDAWRLCSDAVNLMETLIKENVLQDDGNLLMDAITALAEAGKRNLQGKPLRLSGSGMQAVRAILEDYAAAIDVLSARTMIRAHRLTERRLIDIMQGRKMAHDVEIIFA
jgi:uncharacterized protein YyaL (SSP411 family)